MTEQIQPHVLEQYKILQKVGSGAYGHVWKVQQYKTNHIYALKKNFDAFSNSTDAQRTYRQIMFLRQLKHPTIIKLHRVHRAHNDKDIYLVFEYLDIDLYALCRQQSILTPDHKKYIIYQVAKAIYFLHQNGIIHRDIKPSNILVNQNCEAKLCDFGLVRSVQQKQGQDSDVMTDYIATRWYRAPEILFVNNRYDKSIDVWSFGCLMGQIMKGKPMFAGNSTLNQLQLILNWTGIPSNKDLNQFQFSFPKQAFSQIKAKHLLNSTVKKQQFVKCKDKAFMQLLQKTLSFNPAERPTILQILKNPYFGLFYKEDQKQIQKIHNNKTQITVPVDDNIRLNLSQYRQLIYCEISVSNQLANQKLSQPETIGLKKQSKNRSSKKKMTTDNDQNILNSQTCSISKEQRKSQSKKKYYPISQQTSTNASQSNSNKKQLIKPRTKISSSLEINHHLNRIINNLSKQPGTISELNSFSKKKKGISLYSKKVKTELADQCAPSKEQFSQNKLKKNKNQQSSSKGIKRVQRPKTNLLERSPENQMQNEVKKESLKQCLQQSSYKKNKKAINIKPANFWPRKVRTQQCQGL